MNHLQIQQWTKKNKKGQLLLEALWLVLFAFTFLTTITYLYKKGHKEITYSRYK